MHNTSTRYLFQSCIIPRFNAKGSDYPFTFINFPVDQNYDQSNILSRIRFGEKRAADKFLSCAEDNPNTIPNDTEAFQFGSYVDISDGKNFRGLYYRIVTYLESLPNINYGMIHNEGGEIDYFPFNAFASFKSETEKSDIVFGVNEGFAITSNYEWYGLNQFYGQSGSLPTTRFVLERGSPLSLLSTIRNYEQNKILAGKYGDDYQMITTFIYEGTKGWFSFWLVINDVDEYRPAATPFYYFKFQDAWSTAGIDVPISWNAIGPFANIDLTRLNHIVFRWDFMDNTKPVATMQVNESQPKDILYLNPTWTPAVSMAFNFIQFHAASAPLSNYSMVRIFGICQGGDFIPFVHAGSNRSFGTMQFSINNASEVEKISYSSSAPITSYTPQLVGPVRSTYLLNYYSFAPYFAMDPYSIVDFKHRSLKLCYPENDDLHLVSGFSTIKTYGSDTLNRGLEISFWSTDLNWNMGAFFSNSGTTTESRSGYPESYMKFAGLLQPAKLNTHWRNDYSWNQTQYKAAMWPFSFNVQEHPKYAGEWIENCWRERYAFGWADDTIKASGAIPIDFPRTQIILGNTAQQCGNIHMSSLIHQFVEPDNSAFYWKDPIAMPEIYRRTPRRMRKAPPAFLGLIGHPHDDFTIYPSHLGHSRCIEVSRLHIKDRTRYDYQKYTATPNSNPTNFWVTFWVTGHSHDNESQGEIVLYDTAGAQILYLQVNRATAATQAYPKIMKYAKDSASAYTSINLQWNGWLPVTIEVSTSSQRASIYYYDKLVVSNITLNAGLVGFGAIVFTGGKYIDPAVGNSQWADFDSGGVTVPDGGLLIDGLTWSCADTSGTSFRTFARHEFMQPYKPHICPHQSTFFNNINGGVGNILKPLPPTSMPTAQILDYNVHDWEGGYWTFDNQILDPAASIQLFSGTVHNWYLWKFPFVFGGKDYFFGAGSGYMRGHLLKHVGTLATSGKLEIVMGAVITANNAAICIDVENKSLPFGGGGGTSNATIKIEYASDGKCNVTFNNVYLGSTSLLGTIDRMLHKITMIWSPRDTGNFTTIYIDDKKVLDNVATDIDYQGIQIYDMWPLGGASVNAYAIVWGAQMSNEDTFKEGVLDLIPGGTVEPEAVAGQQISRNSGLFVFNNLSGDWTWENAHFFKTLVPYQNTQEIRPALVDPQQDMLIELERSGSVATGETIETFDPYNEDAILPLVNPKWKIVNTFSPGTDFWKKKTVTILGSPYEVLQLDKGASPSPVGFGEVSTTYSVLSPAAFRDKWFQKFMFSLFVEPTPSPYFVASLVDKAGNSICKVKIDGTTFYIRDGTTWMPLFYWPDGWLDYCSMPISDDIATLPHWTVNRNGESNPALSYGKVVSVGMDNRCRIKNHPPQSWTYPLVYNDVRNVELRNNSASYPLDVTLDLPTTDILPPAAASPFIQQFQLCFSSPDYANENFYILDTNGQVMIWIQRRNVSGNYRFTVWYGTGPTAWNTTGPQAITGAWYYNYYVKITHGTGANSNQVQIEFWQWGYPYSGTLAMGTTPWINLYMDRTWSDPIGKLKVNIPAGANRYVWMGQFYHSWKDGNVAGAQQDLLEMNFVRSSENRVYLQQNTYFGWKDWTNFRQNFSTADSYWNTPDGAKFLTYGSRQAKAYIISIDTDDWIRGYQLNQNNQNTIMETGDLGLVNTDLTSFGRYVSLYMYNGNVNWKNTSLTLFNSYTFTDGYVTEPFNFKVIGLKDSLPKLLMPFALQLSQISDGTREIYYNFIPENKEDYTLDLALTESFTISKPLSPEAKKIIVELLRRKVPPTKSNLIYFMSVLFGLEEKYITVSERATDAIVDVGIPVPSDCEIPINWVADIQAIINKFKPAGVTYAFYYSVVSISDNGQFLTTVTFV